MTAGSVPISVWGNTTPSFISSSSSITVRCDIAPSRIRIADVAALSGRRADESRFSQPLYSRWDDDSPSRSLVLAALGRLGGRRRAARRGGRLFDGGRGRQPVGVSRDVRDDGAVRASDATG